MRSLAARAFALTLVAPGAAWASQGPGAGQGAAGSSAQALAGALAALPLAGVVILAAIKLARGRPAAAQPPE